MPTLVSPGVAVTVIDESFYGSAGAGTVPLIILATASNKAHPSGVGTADSTTKSELSLITSQRELIQSFGDPLFYSASGTQLHSFELNEYGLLAAHSYLGAANRAYILRADIDLGELSGTAIEPAGPAVDGTHWLDMSETTIGLFEYSGTEWVSKEVTMIYDTTQLTAGVPNSSIGEDGDYAFVAEQGGSSTLSLYYKVTGTYEFLDGTTPDIQFATHLAIPTLNSSAGALVTGDVYIKTTIYNNGSEFVVKSYNVTTATWTEIPAPLHPDSYTADDEGSGKAPIGTLFTQHDPTATNRAEFIIKRRTTDDTIVTGTIADAAASGTTFTINSTPISIIALDDIHVVAGKITSNATMISTEVIATAVIVNGSTYLRITKGDGGELTFTSDSSDFGFTATTYSSWLTLSHTPDSSAPTGRTLSDTRWYDPTVTKIDLLQVDSFGTAWEDYSGILTAASVAPTTPSSGDVWVDTTDLENYPAMSRYNGAAWVTIDRGDQTTSSGIVFGDFRELATSVNLDLDAPDPATYPAGMLGWNMRASGYNVKKFIRDYAQAYGGADDRWVTESGLYNDGSPYSGRHARKRSITQAMAAAIVANDDLRSDTVVFNLMAAPGFPELIDEMTALNVDRKETAFVVADTPFRLQANGTDIQDWATNANNADGNGEVGLISSSPYVGVYYPSGLATNTNGAEVVVPASHIVLRTMAYNDSVAYPWFAPAGAQRGLVSNVSSTGYIDSEGEYVATSLSEGLRDVLYSNKINPITFMSGIGLVVYGQKTLNPFASALDRVNVARLVNYLRERFEVMAKPFLFEPNDQRTRDNVLGVFNGFMADIASKRGLYDYLVVCDSSNNTPTRIDKNELWIDVAIQPMKAIEFIYIPIRVKNTGESLI